MAHRDVDARAARLSELARLFLRLGATAFGGPAAHIAMMEDEVVRRRGWLSRTQFLDLLGATNLIPGPNSTEMAIHVGYLRAGWAGLVVAGVCFIVPAALVVAVIAAVYVRLGTLPQAAALLYGMKPVVIAIVLHALWGLGRTAIKSMRLAAIGVAAVALTAAGVDELLVLALAGAASMVTKRSINGSGGGAPAVVALPLAATTAAAPFGLWALGLFFLKVGSVLFGSGYVLLAFLRADLVVRWGWLTEAQLLDATAVGQVTPGPVFTTATFIGYVLAGPLGALIATVGIFLPAFFFVAVSGPLIPRLRQSPTAAALLDGVNVGSLALMAAVTWYLGRTAVIDLPTAALAVTSLLLLGWRRVSSAWLVLGGAVVGLVLR
ncbi:MAG: chromate efflux transporter [Deltaproteobacteria bacterium]|nr:chromate efflux transporter [Deltaproteobacteria bacterium]MBI3388840.1 chromate efflux transporter [Deltaproteobacteria bacterium]